MQTSYIYSVSRANTLAQFLLSKTDVERLLVASGGDDLHEALKETNLAPYIAHAPNEDVPLAIEQNLIDAKRLIHQIAPDGDMFRVLWVQYDIHNLRVFAKGKSRNQSYEELTPFVSKRGVYEPDYLYAKAEEGTLSSLQADWQAAYDQAGALVKDNKINEVDGVFDELYFKTSQRIAAKSEDSFIKLYLTRAIDLYNLKSRLRHLQNEGVTFQPEFVSGGSIPPEILNTFEDVYQALSRLGGEEFWQEAIEAFKTTGNFTLLDATSMDYLVTLAKEKSHDMFSSASLVLYYLKCRQSASNVRTIVVGKNNGLTDEDIRANLSMAYVND